LAATLVALTIAVVSTLQYVRTARIAELRSDEASQAAEIAERREQEAKHILAMKLLQEAEDSLAKKNVQSAIVLSASARKVYDSSDVRNRALSIQYLAKGDEQLARNHLKLAMDSVFQEAFNTALLPHRIERKVRGAAIRAIFEKWLLLTMDYPESAYAEVLRFKGLDSRVEMKQRTMLRQHSTGRQTLQERLSLVETRVAGLSYGLPDDAGKQAKWESNYVTATAELTDLYVQLGDLWRKDRSPWQEAHWKDIQRRLKSNEAIIDFVLYRERYAAFVLRSSGFPERIELGGVDNMERIAQFVTSGVANFWTGPKSRSSQEANFRGVVIVEPDKNQLFERDAKWNTLFRDSVWRPIEVALGPGVTTIYLVPEGVFATLPFAAMAGRSQGSMLVDQYLFVHLSSAHDLLQDTRREQASDSILLIGGADYDYGVGNKILGSMRGRLFSALPGSEMEVDIISRIIGKHAVALTGGDASEVTFRNSASGRRVLHLATHGWATSDLLPVTDVGAMSSGIDAYFASLDPFLRAGVALAGANRRSEDAANDGILTAMEMTGLNLGGTELVVLSGCETVGTARAGESTLALVRSLREAGVDSVIATLYLVDDQATARFMASFYEKYMSGIAPAEAMRRAQLEERRAGSDPYIWAPFVVYGPGHNQP
jgi:CHAT domain-containing protein